MILNKIKNFFHRFLKSFATDKIIYLPAVIIFLLAMSLIGFVYFSDTSEFTPCTIESIGCMENIETLPKVKQIKKVFVCASKTAWCDTQVLFQKCSNKNSDDILTIPDNTQNDKISTEEINQLFEKISTDMEKNVSSDIDGNKLMEEARTERLEGEKHFQELIDSIVKQQKDSEIENK
ncbi:MAG: hypothetical protein MJ250_01555 [Alphaproteobacteria bacterium]|nr:hypothetical protein [Alphaproteobacteria bacterium]